MFLQQLQEKITKQVQTDPDNSFTGQWLFYDPPLVGAAFAADSLFLKMKEEKIAGEQFMLPEEWLPGAVSVISYFLPFTREVRTSNHTQGKASMEWLHSRFQGETFNDKIRKLIIKEIESFGEKAVAPMLDERKVIDFNELASNWSERHAAYVAGLGTFSLNRGMITVRGMAGRFGSVITTLKVEPTPKDYSTPFEYCPELMEGSCGMCIDRCPSGAITSEGKDKQVCFQHLFIQDPLKEEREPYGYPYSACGKCQTNVPCEYQVPK